MTHPRGVVLIQALVLVAALSAAAVLLLAQAETGRARLDAALGVDQRAQMLDAGEALARARLAQGAVPVTDGPRPLDRGSVAVAVAYPEGQFNLNWLADPEDHAALDAFGRLIATLGLPASLALSVPKAVRQGGPVLLPDQAFAGLSRGVADRLRAQVTALPVGSRLDLNRATEPVLAALLPALSQVDLARLIAVRDTAPLPSLAAAGTAAGAALPPDRFTVATRFLLVTVTARLEDRSEIRVTLFERRPDRGPDGDSRVVWRMAVVP